MNADQIRLKEIHRKAAAGYQNGCREASELVPREDGDFLKTLGVSTQVLLDYAEDFVHSGEPDCATFVRLVEIRRDYFRGIQKGIPPIRPVPESELPRKSDQWEGIAWAPRITSKARCFLEGTLCPEVMYGCSGDRAFLQKFHLTLSGFLEAVKEFGNDEGKILQSIRGA